MSGVPDADARLLPSIASLGGALGLALCFEVIALATGIVAPPNGYLVGVVTSLVCTVGVIYGSYRLPRSGLSPDRFDRIVRWCFGGALAFTSINIGFMFSIPVNTAFEAASWTRWAVSLGGGTGMAIGLFEARAIDREVDAERARVRQTELRRRRDRLEEFADVVSHDLRNPLNVATGRLKLARGEHDGEHLDDVSRALDRIHALSDDLRTIARQGGTVTDRDPVDLEALVDACWGSIDAPRASLETAVDRPILADENRLRRLIVGLLRNAIDHGGPDVTIRVGGLDDGFYVADDGPGIPEVDRDDVFRPGHSTAEDGTGFGLCIVEEIVVAHDWNIEVTEGDDGGARFEITGVEFAAERTRPASGSSSTE